MTTPVEVTEEHRRLANDVLYGGSKVGYDVKWPAVNELGERIAQAIAAAELRGAERERWRVRVEMSCIWEPCETASRYVICKNCRWAKSQGPYIHVDSDSPEAAAIRARKT